MSGLAPWMVQAFIRNRKPDELIDLLRSVLDALTDDQLSDLAEELNQTIKRRQNVRAPARR